MRSLVYLCAILSICNGGPVRQKRGWSSGFNKVLDVFGNGWSTGVGTIATGWRGGDWNDIIEPAQKVITINKIVNVEQEVSVPEVVFVHEVITEPRIVTVKKLVPSPGTKGLYSGGHMGRYAGGYKDGYAVGGYGEYATDSSSGYW